MDVVGREPPERVEWEQSGGERRLESGPTEGETWLHCSGLDNSRGEL